jgi:GT2 family glycosyltransferase
MQCLYPLREQRVIVVDDCTPDDRGQKALGILARKYPLLEVIHQDTNKGFIEACHTGFAHTEAEKVLFLNSDTIPNVAAIEHMAQQDAAIVGCRLLFPNGTIQHAGVARTIHRDPYHPFMHLAGDTPHACRVMEVNAVTGAAFMVRRDVWLSLEGFDRFYDKGVFEDVDFSWRARAKGYRIVYDGAVSMIHHMHGSYVEGQEYFHDGGQINGGKLRDRFGNLGSDEELFYGKLP